MTRFIICIIFIFFFTIPTFAQEKQDRHQQIEALKASYITKRLDLTPEEAQKFWPVYNEYQGYITNIYRKKRENQQVNKDNAQEALKNDLDYDTQILNVKKKYQKEFSKVLPSEKVLALIQAEREFREELIKELKERRKQ